MHKLKSLILLVMIIPLSIFISVKAEASVQLPDGLLIGDDQGISITKDGGYFFNLENLRPGDAISRKLTIENTRAEDYDLDLTIQPNSKTGKIDLVEEISMTITMEDKQLYTGNLCSDDEGNLVKRRTIDFGTIKSGDKRIVNIDLLVSPNIDFWDYYSGESEAIVDWIFVARSDEESPGTSTPGKTGLLPQTGEERAKLYLLLAVMFLLAAALIYRQMLKESP
ncbi:LPXTG cell wall anchor domain-containing protein [Vagococcus acidifermentans]|uniref:Gram-positive cocci surface proteins LPxTG domain-containing protein n=1 Tax=Vagococcus acidifermentans TaxID=564710 RepID=A0A430B341_9ENTE|nr:LPXTG cell wall anchor domain-containing protein [Vagococcus acidifermentans]RSU14612.1 hypothetical protein CBF27_01110 [Vagococcus acidifermentans]